jgi:hypothetical protein
MAGGSSASTEYVKSADAIIPPDMPDSYKEGDFNWGWIGIYMGGASW